MGRALVLLLIGVMEAALHRLQSENIPKAISLPENTGALATAFPAETSYPISEWSASLWMFTNQNQGVLIATQDPYASLEWYGTSLALYNGANSIEQTTSEDMSGKWVFYQLGSTTVVSYITVTIRNVNQYFLFSSTPVLLQGTSSIVFFQVCGLSVITI